MQKFGRYFARKGWFGFDREVDVNSADVQEDIIARERVDDAKKGVWRVGESGSRILVEVATAYAITKVLLPARVILSVWATPWFARNVLHKLGGLRGVFSKGKGSALVGNGTTQSAAAGTGAGVGKTVEKGLKLP